MSPKQSIRADSLGDHPWDHLLPVIRAEQSWGNGMTSAGWVRDPKLGEWTATMVRPLHISRLLETFDFPDSIKVAEGTITEANGVEIKQTTVCDTRNDITIMYYDWRSDTPTSVVRLVDRVRGWFGGSGRGASESGEGE